jgi:hypothetical protein
VKLPVLYNAKGLYKIQVGPRTAESVRRCQALSPAAANAFRPRARTTTHSLCLCYTFSSQQSSSVGKGNHKEWQNGEAAIPGVLHLRGSNRVEKYCSEMKKMCYVAVMSARKLHHYFEAHTIHVLTNQPWNDIFGNRDGFGRISKCEMDLSKHVVDFEKRTTIKS